ncbi:MAG: GIY-YIG nuclease family protein [Peptostreptococcales bacterium]
MNYIYIIECQDKTLYTGYTTDIEKRIEMHNKGLGAKYTRGRGPVVLKYFEEFHSKNDALKREKAIQKLSRVQKLHLINGALGKEEE